MKLQTALEVAKDCGLETVGEAIYNVKINAWEWTKSHRRTPDGKLITEDTPVNVILKHNITEDK